MSGKKQSGQILLIVVLVIVVASTIGLSLASRSITSLKTSTEEAESQKALAAAEAGIERAIQGNVLSPGLNVLYSNDLGNKSSYSVDITGGIQNSTFLVNGGNKIQKDEGADIWFVEHNPDGSLDYSTVKNPNFVNLYWGSTTESCSNQANMPAAIEAIAHKKAS